MTKENFWLMKSEPDAYSIDNLKQKAGSNIKYMGQPVQQARYYAFVVPS